MSHGVENEFNLMKSRIRSTHLHDNDGHEDQHLFPGEGTIDWSKAMQLLASHSSQYPLLLELKEPAGVEFPIKRAKESIQELIKRI